MSERCHECKYKEEVPGNCHVKCNKGDGDPLMLMAAVIKAGNCEKEINNIKVSGDGWSVELSPHGIRNGWCFFPLVFDPTWVYHCSGFCEKGEVELYG